MSNEKNTNKKFWNFTRPQNGAAAELIIYGEISSVSWFGDEVTPKQFSDELNEALKNSEELVVRINSSGGDVFAAYAIYTRLRDCKKNVIVKVDGWAASAATIIAMAGQVRLIPISGVFMVHDPSLSLWGGYTAEDMAKMQKELELIKSSIIKIYAGCTGLPEDEISRMMSEETWLLGMDAVEKGFCTGYLLEDVEVKPQNNGHVFVNHVDMDISRFKGGIKFADTAKALPVPHKQDGCDKPKNEEKEKAMENEKATAEEITTVEQLKNAYPALVDEIVNSERKRIRDIEEVSVPGFENLAQEAKFDKPQSAADLAVAIVKAQKAAGVDYLANREQDNNDGNVKDAAQVNDFKENVGGSHENEAIKIMDRIAPIKK